MYGPVNALTNITVFAYDIWVSSIEYQRLAPAVRRKRGLCVPTNLRISGLCVRFLGPGLGGVFACLVALCLPQTGRCWGGTCSALLVGTAASQRSTPCSESSSWTRERLAPTRRTGGGTLAHTGIGDG
ncbi:hypothetical protein VFPBJ_08906 [Purpureocillium lilacinum]|uniref:Uncharacterized protein n=1 Tax=Purpureocillium lilacinum TaxID=33203 RepID=A0A179GFE3_PURLI|nr:hypothetical protein VFPBJ_08906 [Purpureocillium lilacinum]